MTQITFTVPGVPIAQPRQRHRIMTAQGRTFVKNYTPSNAPVNTFKAACQIAARGAYQGPPLIGPLSVTLQFIFPRPKCMTFKKRPMPRVAKTGKPDIDNVFKAFADSLNGMLWMDDAQVSRVTIEKWTAAGDEQPRTEVSVATIS